MSSPIFSPEIPSFREALKTAVKRTQLNRAYLKDCVVLSDGKLWVSYRGEQLDVNDWRVFDELVRRVDGHFNVPLSATCQEVCLSLGLTSIDAFQEIVSRLRIGSVYIDDGKNVIGFCLISDCLWTDDGELKYVVSANAAKFLSA